MFAYLIIYIGSRCKISLLTKKNIRFNVFVPAGISDFPRYKIPGRSRIHHTFEHGEHHSFRQSRKHCCGSLITLPSLVSMDGYHPRSISLSPSVCIPLAAEV